MSREHAAPVAELHCANIRSLLSDLGPSACRAFYESALESPRNFGFVDEERGRLRAFCFGTVDSSRVFSSPRSRAALVRALLRRPRTLWRAALRLRDVVPHGPEALYEAVDPEFRRQGIATRLYAALDRAFRTRDILVYQVRIDAHNEANLALRQRAGARIESEFVEDGLRRFRLVVRLAP